MCFYRNLGSFGFNIHYFILAITQMKNYVGLLLLLLTLTATLAWIPPNSGEGSAPLWAGSFTQESEVTIADPTINCKPGGDGTMRIRWDRAADWLEMCIFNASLPYNVTFHRPQTYDWQKATTDYNRRIQDFDQVSTYRFCLISNVFTSNYAMYYQKESGKLMGARGDINPVPDHTYAIKVDTPLVGVWEGDIFEASPTGSTTHCETVSYTHPIQPIEKTGGGLALFPQYNLCDPSSTGPYYLKWGFPGIDATGGDDLIAQFIGQIGRAHV